MNVYDFDNTIYDGDSTIDFYLYCIKTHPNLLRYLPKQLWAAILYLIGKLDKTRFKERFYIFLRGLKNIDCDMTAFWNRNEHKIKKWYLKNKKNTDAIISASPEFLLEPICNKLGIIQLLASKVDCETGHYIGINCYGMEKVNRFIQSFGEYQIDEFYSDSKSDLPLAELARKAYIVSGNKISPWAVHNK